jgi:protein TonB
MDRVHVVSAPISLGAHALGAAILTVGPLLVPEPLPAPRLGQLLPPLSQMHAVVSIGQGGLTRGAPAKPSPTRIFVPTAEPRIAEPPAPELLGSEALSDLPGDGPGPGEPGLCVFECGGSSSGPVRPSLSAVPEPKKDETRIRAGGMVQPPQKVHDVSPEYPPLALAARLQGSVVIECVITAEGSVSELTVLRGHPLLNAAAVAAVSRWRYRPTMLNGAFVSVILTVTVDFRLR